MNIVAMAAQYLTPMIVDRIASSFGLGGPIVSKAINAILPTITAGLLGASQKPAGLKALAETLAQQDAGLLGNLGELIGGTGQTNLVKNGTNVLGSLLGGSAVGAIASAAGKFAGIGDAPAKGLVGMLAPVVLGTLAQQQKSQGLDAAGLAGMLMGQKDNISTAIPKGFSDLLAGSGLLDSIAPAATPRVAAPSAASPAARPPAPAQASGGLGWMKWAAILAAAAVIGGWWFDNLSNRRVALPAAPKIVLNNVDIGSQLATAVDGLRTTLATVRDEASARSALPKLQDTLKQLDGVNEARSRLPADSKKSLASYVTALLPIIRPLVDNALKATGVGAVAKPVLDNIMSRLEAIAKA